MTYEEVMEYWLTQKPVGAQSGKTLWLMIANAIEKQTLKKIKRVLEWDYLVGVERVVCKCPSCHKKIADGIDFLF